MNTKYLKQSGKIIERCIRTERRKELKRCWKKLEKIGSFFLYLLDILQFVLCFLMTKHLIVFAIILIDMID